MTFNETKKLVRVSNGISIDVVPTGRNECLEVKSSELIKLQNQVANVVDFVLPKAGETRQAQGGVAPCFGLGKLDLGG